MKIVFLSDNWNTDFGGRKKILKGLINSLGQNYEIAVLNLDTNFTAAVDNKIYSVYQKNNLVGLIKATIILLKKTYEERPKLIFLAARGPHSNAFFGLIPVLLGVKFVILDQGDPLPIIKKQNYVVKFISRIIYKLADKIVSVSFDMKSRIIEEFGVESIKIIAIHNFIGPEVEAMSRVNLPANDKHIFDKKVICSISRLDLKSKDLITLINAFELFSNEFNLLILGDGPDKSILESLILKKNLANKVYLRGNVENPYLYLSKSFVFVLCSFHEGLPLSIIEAMACGLPVISTDCDFGPRELIKNHFNGLLVNVGDVNGLKSALFEIINDSEMRNIFIKNGYIVAREHYIENKINEYQNLIDSLR